MSKRNLDRERSSSSSFDIDLAIKEYDDEAKEQRNKYIQSLIDKEVNARVKAELRQKKLDKARKLHTIDATAASKSKAKFRRVRSPS